MSVKSLIDCIFYGITINKRVVLYRVYKLSYISLFFISFFRAFIIIKLGRFLRTTTADKIIIFLDTKTDLFNLYSPHNFFAEPAILQRRSVWSGTRFLRAIATRRRNNSDASPKAPADSCIQLALINAKSIGAHCVHGGAGKKSNISVNNSLRLQSYDVASTQARTAERMKGWLISNAYVGIKRSGRAARGRRLEFRGDAQASVFAHPFALLHLLPLAGSAPAADPFAPCARHIPDGWRAGGLAGLTALLHLDADTPQPSRRPITLAASIHTQYALLAQCRCKSK